MDADIYMAVAARANNHCENGNCGVSPSTFNPLELDHFAGRKHQAEQEYNCWLLCRNCHFAKTNSKPSAGVWFQRFIDHCNRWANRADPKNGYLLAAAEAKKNWDWRVAKGTTSGAA